MTPPSRAAVALTLGWLGGTPVSAGAEPVRPPQGPAALKVIDRIAATVNDEVVLLSEVEERAKADLALGGGSSESEAARRARAMRKALDDLIADRLLDSEMRVLAIDVAEHEVDYSIEDVKKQNKMDDGQFEKALATQGFTIASYRSFMQKQLARMKLLQLKVRSKVRVSDEDVKAEYDRLARLEQADEEVRARHILLRIPRDPTPKDEAAVLARAQDLMRRARAGEDFVALAKKHSEGPSRDDGGDLGYFRRGAMVPEFERTAFALKVGEVSEPVKTSFGYHLLKLEDRRKVAPKPFEEIREDLRERRLKDLMDQYTRSYVDELRRSSEVDVKLPELKDGAESPGAP